VKSEYRKIAGLGIGRGRLEVGLRSRLYQGGDHLLLVRSTGYSEEYKRIAYQNIRYIVIRRTHGRERQAIISSLLLVLVGLLYFAHLPWGVVVVMEIPFFIWFIANLVRGESCRTYVNTDIQTLELPVPRRINKVPILTDFLSKKITAASPTAVGVT
jgi:hypothetical protein